MGHRKRLLYGISELKRINPDWTLSSSSSSPLLPHNAPAGPISRVNFARDYTKIQSLKPHPPEMDQLELFDDHAHVNWTSSKLQKTTAAPTNHTSSSHTPSDHTPSDTPVRGSDYATSESSDTTDQADHTPSSTPDHAPTKRASFDLPPAQVKNYRTLVRR